MASEPDIAPLPASTGWPAVPEVAAPDVGPVAVPEAVPEDVAGVPEVAPDDGPPEVPATPDGAEPAVELAPAAEGVPEPCPSAAPDCPAEEAAFEAPQAVAKANSETRAWNLNVTQFPTGALTYAVPSGVSMGDPGPCSNEYGEYGDAPASPLLENPVNQA